MRNPGADGIMSRIMYISDSVLVYSIQYTVLVSSISSVSSVDSFHYGYKIRFHMSDVS